MKWCLQVMNCNGNYGGVVPWRGLRSLLCGIRLFSWNFSMYLHASNEDYSVSCWGKWQAHAIVVLCSDFHANHALYVLQFQSVKPMKTVLLAPSSRHSSKLSTYLCSTSSWSTCLLLSLSRYHGILLQKQKQLILVLPTLLQKPFTKNATAGACWWWLLPHLPWGSSE